MVDRILDGVRLSQDDDYYCILQCDQSATNDQINAEYKCLVLKYHPDKTSDLQAENKFALIQKAKNILGDPVKRKLYDEWLSNHIPIPFDHWLSNKLHTCMHWKPEPTKPQMIVATNQDETYAHKWEVADSHHEDCLDKCCNVGRLDINQWYNWWCVHQFAHLLPGDFNGDGYCDFACIDKYGVVYTTYWLPAFNKLRFPSGGIGHITSYLCDRHRTSNPLVYDVDKDGIDDILCVKDVTRSDGKVAYRGMRGRHPYILYGTWPDNIINNNGVTSEFIVNEPKQNFAVKQMECSKFNNECSHITLEIVHQFIGNTWCNAAGFKSGDIDGDGYCDATCNAAFLYVLYFVADIGRFQAHSHRYNAAGQWSVTQGYCTSSLYELQLLDINRDGIHDLVCTPVNDATNPYKINTILGVSLVDISLGSNIVGLHVMLEEVRKINNIDQAMSCSVTLDSTSSIDTVNPCSNVTRLSAYLQANAVSVIDAQFGSFCKNADTAQFISADIDGNGWCDMICYENKPSVTTSVYVQYLAANGLTYSKRIDSPANTAGQGAVFTCSDSLYTVDLNHDSKWDLVCTDTTICTGAQVFYWMSPADGNGFNSATNKEQMTMDGTQHIDSDICPEITSTTEPTTTDGNGFTSTIEQTTSSGNGFNSTTEQTTADANGITSTTEHPTASGEGFTLTTEQTTTDGNGFTSTTEPTTADGNGFTSTTEQTTASGNGFSSTTEPMTASGNGPTTTTEPTTADGNGFTSTTEQTTTDHGNRFTSTTEHTAASGNGFTSITKTTTADDNGLSSTTKQTTADGIGLISTVEQTTADGNGLTSTTEQTTADGNGFTSPPNRY